MSATSNCNCQTFRALEAADEDFWKSPQGILRRIDSLAQDLNYKTVNGAVKMIAPTNGVMWLHWITAADDRVCPRCVQKSESGRGKGFFKISDFTPKLPQHKNCRCQWELLFYNPLE